MSVSPALMVPLLSRSMTARVMLPVPPHARWRRWRESAPGQ